LLFDVIVNNFDRNPCVLIQFGFSRHKNCVFEKTAVFLLRFVTADANLGTHAKIMPGKAKIGSEFQPILLVI